MQKSVVTIFAILLAGCAFLALALFVLERNRAPEFTSSHTPLDVRCETEYAEGNRRRGTGAQICRGYGAYRLRKTYAAVGMQLSVETEDRSFNVPVEVPGDCLPSYGERIEWRLADREPFAVIVNVKCYKKQEPQDGYSYFADENRTGEFWVVRGLKNFKKLNLFLDTKTTPNAEERARALADEMYAEDSSR